MEIVLVGLNHRTAPVEMRERVAFSAEQARQAAGELRGRGILLETVVLSTCNRSELYGVPPAAAPDCAREMEDFLACFHQLAPATLDGCLYRQHNLDAVRHLYRVAAGLDSQLLGEAEILGQVREAYRVAFDHGLTGPVLNRMFQGALEVGKRVRAKTEIGARPMSVAFAGVKLAEHIFGDFRRHTALILGAGAVGEQVVEHMRGRGIARLLVANRSRARAEELARRFDGEVVDWEALPQALAQPDIVVASVSGEKILTREMIERAMAARENRALFLMDLGVPRNVEPAAASLRNVYLYNIDHLSEVVEQNRKAREREIPRVEGIIEEHLGKFTSWRDSAHAAALRDELRARLEEARAAFLSERMDAMAQLGEEERAALARQADELLRRILQDSGEHPRDTRELQRRLERLAALRELFRLHREKP
jgi:glutamyl-tRNA reductase